MSFVVQKINKWGEGNSFFASLSELMTMMLFSLACFCFVLM